MKDMRTYSKLLAFMLMFTASNLLADVTIPYGEGSGKADFINNNKYPKIDDPQPTGPLSFRVIGDNVWVADSVGNKLMQFGKDSKLISEFSVLPKDTPAYKIEKTEDNDSLPILNMIIDDFAPVYNEKGELEAWWVADSCKNKLVKFSVDGKLIGEITNPDFGQLYRVEVGQGGHIFVADKVAASIFVYDSDGNLLSKQNWEWSGMAVSGADDVLYRLMYDNEAKKNVLVISTVDGKVVSGKPLDVVGMFNPKLWWVDESIGEYVITYSPAEFKGFYNIVRVGFDGTVKASGEVPAPIIMNRFIEKGANGVFIGKGNFFEAPNGNFEVVPYKLP